MESFKAFEQAALFRHAPQSVIGVASGLFNMSRNAGAIAATLLIGFVMSERFSFAGFRLLAIILTGIALSLWNGRKPRDH